MKGWIFTLEYKEIFFLKTSQRSLGQKNSNVVVHAGSVNSWLFKSWSPGYCGTTLEVLNFYMGRYMVNSSGKAYSQRKAETCVKAQIAPYWSLIMIPRKKDFLNLIPLCSFNQSSVYCCSGERCSPLVPCVFFKLIVYLELHSCC